MHLVFLAFLALSCAGAATTSTQGLYDLAKRRVPDGRFTFTLQPTDNASGSEESSNGRYTVTENNGCVDISGNSLSAMAYALRHYLTDTTQVAKSKGDMYWFIGSRMNETSEPTPLPWRPPFTSLSGESIVPWRYYFNTVTFSYTTPFWSWADWETELDWLALHGVNLPLAWVGFEKILLDVFSDIGLTEAETFSFFSGPAFQSWNRFGNIQGSWGGQLPKTWIDGQFALQKQILTRMLDLGMTPILPAFTGFVPRALVDHYPNATVVNGSRWEDFPIEYTNTTFLEPSDPLFEDLQNRVIAKQIEHYGNVTQFYTLDQYNENDPYSGDLDYLRNVTYGTWKSLKSANRAAIWVMQGWLFTSNADFWTNERIEAYLSGVEEDSDMLILDLFSESQPQWQRTNSYYGKPWIWNQLHDYGGNQGLYGQIENITINPIEALKNSSSLVGFGLTPEGQEGNEIMYSLLLDQAWNATPIDTRSYFHNWVNSRYAGDNYVNPFMFAAWELLRQGPYNNTNLTANGVPKAIFELAPNITGLVNRTGHHPTKLNYDPQDVLIAWYYMEQASDHSEELWNNPAYMHDLVDITRQLYANTFLSTYATLIAAWNSTSPPANATSISILSKNLLSSLSALDALLLTVPQFNLNTWLTSARNIALAQNSTNATQDAAEADFYEYNARNQVTLWGPDGEILDYASKSWGGLISGYYLPRWEAFLGYVGTHGPKEYKSAEARAGVKSAEEAFQTVGVLPSNSTMKTTKEVMETVIIPNLLEMEVLCDVWISRMCGW